MPRSFLRHPIICKDGDHLAIWTYLILSAAHTARPGMFGGKQVEIANGQLVTDRASISRVMRLSESKTQRVLKCFESERLIHQEIGYRSRLITMLYSGVSESDGEEVNANRTPSERQPNANRTPSERIYKNKELENIEDNNNHTHTLVDTKGGAGGNFSTPPQPTEGLELVAWLEATFPALQQLPEPLTPLEAATLRKRYDATDIKRIFRDMSNNAATLSKTSTYKTFLAYVDRDFIMATRAELKKLLTHEEVIASLKSGERMVDLYEQADMLGGKPLYRKKSQTHGSA